MSNQKKQTVNFTVVLPSELNEKLEIAAKSEKRSKSQQINWIVEKFLEVKELASQSDRDTENTIFHGGRSEFPND